MYHQFMVHCYVQYTRRMKPHINHKISLFTDIDCCPFALLVLASDSVCSLPVFLLERIIQQQGLHPANNEMLRNVSNFLEFAFFKKRLTHGMTYGRIYGRTYGRTAGQTDRQTERRTDGRTDKRTDGRTDGQIFA